MGYLIAGRMKESGFPVESKHTAILPNQSSHFCFGTPGDSLKAET